MTRRRPAAAPISRRRFAALGIGAGLAAAAGIVARVGYVNATAVPCLTIDIRNEGSDGQLCFADMYLVPERKNEYFMPDVPLFISSEAQYAEAGTTAASAYIGVRPDTEYTIHLPYTHGSLVAGNWVRYDTGYLNPVVDRSFELILSYLPVRRVVDVSVA